MTLFLISRIHEKRQSDYVGNHYNNPVETQLNKNDKLNNIERDDTTPYCKHFFRLL